MRSRDCPTPFKVAYPTKFAARRSIQALRRREHHRAAGQAGQVQPYECSCGAWHVGHRKERPRRPPRELPSPDDDDDLDARWI